MRVAILAVYRFGSLAWHNMAPGKWQRVESSFHAALERPPQDRRAYLEDALRGRRGTPGGSRNSASPERFGARPAGVGGLFAFDRRPYANDAGGWCTTWTIRDLGDAARRSILEEACCIVREARLLGFCRSRCLSGPEKGLVLVRSIWRAEVDLMPWDPRFEV